MSDLVERLRTTRGAGNDHWQDVWEAADEIERLRKRIESAPEEPFGLLKDDAGLRKRVLEWHKKYSDWLFDSPPPGGKDE